MIKRVGFSLCIVTMLLCGCATEPTAPGGVTSSAYAVGDREKVAFDEVVVSLPLQGDSAPYQNLHVALTAFVNPIRQTNASTSDAESIVRRCERRISVRLTAMLARQNPQTLSEGETLREKVAADGQTIVNEAMQQWKDGNDFKVEVAVATWYWTSSSVGRTEQQRRWWD